RFAQLGGMAWCAPRRGSRFIPLKAFFVFAAGPAVNALAAWAGFLVYQSVYIFEPPYGAIFTVPGMWIFLNAFNAAVSLLPYKTSVTGVSLGSDGHQMLQAIFQPAELRSRYVYGRGIIAFTSLRQLGYREQAHHAITEHLRDFLDDVLGLQCLSAAE